VSEKQDRSKVADLRKWIGLVAALLSLSSAAFGVLRTQADMQQRSHVVTEQLASGRLEEKAGDYAMAWDSYQRARTEADADGPIAKLMGGSGKEQQEVRTAQQDLAMVWVRAARVAQLNDSSGDHAASAVADKVIDALSTGLDSSTGVRKADLLAHLGLAYFLKQRDGVQGLDPPHFFREAVAVDPKNPYANAFWGVYLLWNHGLPWQQGSVADAQQHFAAGLSSGREHATVRELQLRTLGNNASVEGEAAWWQLLAEMNKGGEPIDERTQRQMAREYVSVFNNDDQVARLQSVIPPADHAELDRLLLRSDKLDASDKLRVKAMLAVDLEAAGKPADALAAWRDVQSSGEAGRSYNFTARMNEAIKRLGGASPKPH
jgi:hypothetical protein